MHPKLLFDVIYRQAGTLSKAILEGIMNSADAGASKVTVWVTKDSVTIKDNGRGITNIKEIDEFFDTFGQPHSASENKTYAQFRMGRGQMFAFGRNCWRTGPFSMDVDIKNKGLDYAITKSRSVKGCEIVIKLYEQLLPSAIDATIRDLELWVKYAPLEVIVNARLLSNDPETEKWDHVTPEAFIRLKEHGGLCVYNLGIHTMTINAYRLGTSGTVVSRKQLRVNFARNDIQSDCPIWKKIEPLVNKYAYENMQKKKSLNDDERQRIVDRFISKEIDYNALNSYKVITAVTGRQYSVDVFRKKWRWPQFTVAPKGDRVGDNLMKTSTAFVIATETLDRFHVNTLEELQKLLEDRCNITHESWDFKIADFAKLTAGMINDYKIIPTTDCNTQEQIWKSLIESAYTNTQLPEGHEKTHRKILIGESNFASAWTDGCSYIAFNRDFLKKCDLDLGGFGKVAHLLVHESCHVTPDLESHDHDQAFYETYHDAAINIGNMIWWMFSSCSRVCDMMKRRMTKRQLSFADQQIRNQKAIARIAAHAE